MRRTIPVLLVVAALSLGAAAEANAGVDHLPGTEVDDSRGKLIPLPEEIPGEGDTYIDSRISDDVIWIAERFPQIYFGEGYSGPLPGGGWGGCHKCHISDSDHKIGLAVDLYPVSSKGSGCSRAWNQVTRLAKLAEPRQGQTRGPFGWVGYDGDANHGCGNHLHLSWDHSDDYKRHRAADWVEVFDLKN